MHIVRSWKMCMRMLFLGGTGMRNYFSKSEIALWIFSVMLIVISFFAFDRESYLTLLSSLIGVTSLIFNAKGNPFGQFLMILFSLLYGIISFGFQYYGPKYRVVFFEQFGEFSEK